MIITTSDFSASAREEAERLNAVPVGLMNGEQLVALLVEYDIGIRRTSHDVIELGEAEVEQLLFPVLLHWAFRGKSALAGMTFGDRNGRENPQRFSFLATAGHHFSQSFMLYAVERHQHRTKTQRNGGVHHIAVAPERGIGHIYWRSTTGK